MPFQIICNDITKIECDAIVNAANKSLLGGGGVDGAIHRAAGRELLEECKTLGGCETGDAKITKGYKLPSKYIIHTVGPVWHGGRFGEEQLLRSCYRRSFELALQYNCESIAFPLISAGVYGYPKQEAFEIALEETKEFLKDNEMQVFIVVFDKNAFEFDSFLHDNVSSYIEDNYTGKDASKNSDKFAASFKRLYDLPSAVSRYDSGVQFDSECRVMASYAPSVSFCISTNNKIRDLIVLDDAFAVKLLKLIDAKGMTDVECYKKANVSRQTWYKIMNDKEYKPSKATVLCFAIALELNLRETNLLLKSAGYALSDSILFDVIIEYFISNGDYDIFVINETLFEFDQPCLGVLL